MPCTLQSLENRSVASPDGSQSTKACLGHASTVCFRVKLLSRTCPLERLYFGKMVNLFCYDTELEEYVFSVSNACQEVSIANLSFTPVRPSNYRMDRPQIRCGHLKIGAIFRCYSRQIPVAYRNKLGYRKPEKEHGEKQ